MNPASLRELLTAAVDGELSPTERKAAQKLLRESEAARALFAQLKTDAARLKRLPRVPAPGDFADSVLSTIQDRAMCPTPLPPTRKPSPRFNWSALPVWANVATAAAVLVMISAGSYLYFAASHDYYAGKNHGVASKGTVGKGGDVGAGRDNRDSPDADSNDADPSRNREAGPEAIVQRPRELGPEIGPSPREMPADILTKAPDDETEIQPFHLDKIRVSRFFTLHDLAGDEATRKKLTDELRKDELIRLDLFCQSSARALDMVLTALKGRGITVFTDSFVQERLKGKTQPEVMIFTEALSPEEVGRLLVTLGAEDKKRAGAGPGEFETLVAAPFLPADLTKLSRLLGVPNLDAKAAKSRGGVDIRKPLPEGTANQLAASLSRMGSGSPVPSKAGSVAVVVSYSPANPTPAASREIKQFLDRRAERKADAKPLMLVLRTTK
jgi:hypothetical protein